MLALKDRIPPSQRDSAAGDVYRLFLLVVSTSSSGVEIVTETELPMDVRLCIRVIRYCNPHR